MADCYHRQYPPLFQQRRGHTLPGSTCSFTFPEVQEHLCKWNVPGQDFGSWMFPVSRDQHYENCNTHCIPLSCQRALLRAQRQSPPCDACPYAWCISLEKLWRITPTGMTICPLTDIAWTLQVHEDRILKHLVHYITALWWMGFTRFCPICRTNYI